MTYHKTTIILFLFLGCCSLTSHQKNNKNFAKYKELKKTWTLFANAILENDTLTVKKLSTDCILCSNCVTNDQIEDSVFINFEKNNPDNWNDKLYTEFQYIPIDKFINNDLPIIFNNNIKSRLLDPSKIYYVDDEHNKKLYEKSCITNGALFNAKHKEVLVTSIDPSSNYEGAQDAYAFIETDDGFKFCGFSTIP